MFLHRGINHAIAVLSQGIGEYDVMAETRLRMTKGAAELIRFVEYKKAKSFRLNATEADAFCEAWLAFRAGEQSMQSEQQRRAAMKDEAYAIANEYPSIQIQERGKPVYWLVSCQGWHSAGPAIDEDDLLRDVRQARDHYQQLLIPRILPPNGGGAA